VPIFLLTITLQTGQVGVCTFVGCVLSMLSLPPLHAALNAYAKTTPPFGAAPIIVARSSATE
jgi:hypothetical protein